MVAGKRKLSDATLKEIATAVKNGKLCTGTAVRAYSKRIHEQETQRKAVAAARRKETIHKKKQEEANMIKYDPKIWEMLDIAEHILGNGDTTGLLVIYWVGKWIEKNPRGDGTPLEPSVQTFRLVFGDIPDLRDAGESCKALRKVSQAVTLKRFAKEKPSVVVNTKPEPSPKKKDNLHGLVDAIGISPSPTGVKRGYYESRTKPNRRRQHRVFG
jgi:hypothetical protein